MNIKTFMAVAVAALTLAACTAEEPAPAVTADEAVDEQSANDEAAAGDEVAPLSALTPPPL
jgi:hypothetical protein